MSEQVSVLLDSEW